MKHLKTELSIPIPLQSESKCDQPQPASIPELKADLAKTVLTLLMAKDMMFIPYGSTGGATG
ncbi:hypothetical protein OAM01_02040 [bacterium]|nr:hypothetical protein [bacterium]